MGSDLVYVAVDAESARKYLARVPIDGEGVRDTLEFVAAEAKREVDKNGFLGCWDLTLPEAGFFWQRKLAFSTLRSLPVRYENHPKLSSQIT